MIKRDGDKPSYVENILAKLGSENRFDFTFSKDGRIFTPENVARYDAFVFFTTGDLTKNTGDGNPAMTQEGKAALLDAIHQGKGFVGTHSASDTFHTSGSPFLNNGADTDPFIKMLGGEFITHNQQQKSKVTCVDPRFPGMSAVADGIDWVEEWYSLKNFAPDLHVLLVQHTGGMQGPAYQRPDYPGTWAPPVRQGDACSTPHWRTVKTPGTTPNFRKFCSAASTGPRVTWMRTSHPT